MFSHLNAETQPPTPDVHTAPLQEVRDETIDYAGANISCNVSVCTCVFAI